MATCRKQDLSQNPAAMDIVKCNICFDVFKDPRMLPCLHSFCSQCLSAHVSIKGNAGNVFSCPVCRERVELPVDGVNGFRHDFRAIQILDFLENNPQVTSRNERYDCKFCLADGVKIESRYHCVECDKDMCGSCKDAHRERSVFKDHFITERTDALKAHVTAEMCSTHKEETVKFICTTCNEAACPVCAMTSKHRGHDLVDVATALNQYTENFLSNYRTLLQRSSLYQSKLTSLAESEEKIRNRHLASARKIKRRAEDLKEHIQTQEKQLLNDLHFFSSKELKGVYKDQQRLEDTVCQMRRVTQSCGSMVHTPVTPSTVPLYANLCARMELILDLNAVSPLAANSDSDKIEFNFTASSSRPRFGRLVGNLPSKCLDYTSQTQRKYDHMWLLKAKVGTYGRAGGQFDSPRDLMFLRDGCFVIADSNNNRLQTFTSDGLLINVIGEGRIKPWGVCLTHEGQIAVTDNLEKCVKIFRIDGVLVSKFAKLLCPCGIAITKRGDFVVTDFFSTHAYIFRQSGKLILQFEMRFETEQHSCGASRVLVDHRDNIVICDVSNACIKVFSNKGKLINRFVFPDGIISPQGVCEDMQGRYLIADALRENIAVINTKGELIGHVMERGCQLSDVTGISLSPDGSNLAVTLLKSNTVMIFTNAAR